MQMDLPASNLIKRKEFVILFLCLLVGFFLRFYTFDQKSLWLDEIYTFNDAKYGFKDQLNFYKEKPNYLQAPLFPLLTHLFYPFAKPERDLRIIPLIFGILSIPMIYFLSRLFSAHIGLPCAISLTFLVYHISLSQEGRSYSLVLFLGMVGLFFFMKHLITSNKGFLIGAALLFAALFYTSYSSIPFIVLIQVLWLYRPDDKKPALSSFLLLNGLIFLFCLPWILFLGLNYKGQPFTIPIRQGIEPFWSILYGIFHDWLPNLPLILISMILFILLPILTSSRKNAFVLLAALILPIGGLYSYCKLFSATHFFTSRYFISLLPLFFIALFLSLTATEERFKKWNRFFRLKFFFVVLFVASNLLVLPFFYRSEKQDFRGLATYLKTNLRNGDRVAVGTELYIPGILHYLGVYPKDRLYLLPSRRISEKETESQISLAMADKVFTIFYSKAEWVRCITEGRRLWAAVNKITGERLKEDPSYVLKGYFDGSFLNLNRFPTDASIYLFLRDPASPHEKGIDMSIE